MPSLETCTALTTVNSQWNFCPSLTASYIFTAILGITTVLHIFQALLYRKAYCWVIIASGIAQTGAYVLRDISIKNPTNETIYMISFILILVSPLLTNAFVYMILGRMMWNFTYKGKIYNITAWRLGMYFVILDIVALIVQVYGAGSTGDDSSPPEKIMKGLHIYMAGVGIQQFFILVFCVFAAKFHMTCIAERRGQNGEKSPFPLLYTLYACITLITIRIIFRLVEYSSGFESSIPKHEVYQYVLDSLPMWIALVLLNITHPGRIMPGREGDIPSSSERKSKGLYSKMDVDARFSSGGDDMQVLGPEANSHRPRRHRSEHREHRDHRGERR